ncbi:MAG: META domain-containing protein [Actinomycetota bacterium]
MTMPFFFNHRILGVAMALVLGATACGDDATVAGGDEPSTDTATTGLIDRTFWSTEIVVDGAPLDLVDGTRIELRFGADEINADAGCNNLFAGYTLDDDTIVALGVGMTEMGCDPDRHAQDDFVASFLTGRPTYDLDGDTLRLTNADGSTITLLDRAVADPDRTIDGQAWEVTGFFDDTAAWSSAIDEPAVLRFGSPSAAVFDGCTDTALEIDIADDSITVTRLGDWAICDPETELESDYRTDLHRVLDQGSLAVAIDGPNLTMTAPDGFGLTARAVE